MSSIGSVQSSGLLAVGTNQITTSNRIGLYLVYAVTLIPASAACSVQINDTDGTNSKQTGVMYVSGASGAGSTTIVFTAPQECLNGISAVVTGTGAQAIVHYRLA